MSEWCRSDHLKLSIDKTQLLIISKGTSWRHCLKFELDFGSFKKANQIRYLMGVIFDQKLSIIAHLDFVRGRIHKIMQNINHMSRPTWGLGGKTMKAMYSVILEKSSCMGLRSRTGIPWSKIWNWHRSNVRVCCFLLRHAQRSPVGGGCRSSITLVSDKYYISAKDVCPTSICLDESSLEMTCTAIVATRLIRVTLSPLLSTNVHLPAREGRYSRMALKCGSVTCKSQVGLGCWALCYPPGPNLSFKE